MARRVAIITGASSGIGAGIAEVFAKEGIALSLTGRNKKNLDSVVSRCQEHSSQGVVTTIGDITKGETLKSVIQNTMSGFGRIDILVNNAGIGQLIPTTEVTPDEFDKHVGTNLRTPVLLTALVAPHIINSRGCILNISSSTSKISAPLSGLYSMTKAGLDLYTKTLARELGPHGVRVNSLNPGYVMTPLFENMPQDLITKTLQKIEKTVPLGRHGTTEEMGKIAAFLVSDGASFITGQNLVADGGLWLMPGF